MSQAPPRSALLTAPPPAAPLLPTDPPSGPPADPVGGSGSGDSGSRDSGSVTARPDPAVSPAPTPAELLDFVRRTAADRALIASLPLVAGERTWVRLDGPGGSEAWLIGWPPGTGTGWHDHAESHGAFATAHGELTERSLAVRLPAGGWRALELHEGVDRERRLATGQGRAFGTHHVHEVLNESATEHAVSVHAYHPPLPLIRRFGRTGAVLRLEQVEHPEDWQ
ncbi:cupin domain-containing protein [Streptomyces yaizuensis]|uniref:Cysteine dioxygenase n=1 Tax=Streptomyces yaizuensis TaxID=2989713 RepID=A0ABQ5PAU8_9ACTN|nr:cysteine dioxygenase [Streptomyces sp. YSPA8]GLF99701.1 cysteine dioxygenase [Streptomyces sp. YSPA8]